MLRFFKHRGENPDDEKKATHAVLGAGMSGQVMATDLAMEGFVVNLYEYPCLKHVVDPLVTRAEFDLLGS